MTIYDILAELNASNGTNHKIAVLKKHKDNALLQRVLKMTYDKVVYRYYVTMNHWNKKENPFPALNGKKYDLEAALDLLQRLSDREMTGNDAISRLDEAFRLMDPEVRDLIIKMINRDLRINCGRTQINKVFGDLITKPVYMRCGVFTAKTAKDISFPAMIQLKADGTYREMRVENGKAEFVSRTGEQYAYTIDYPYYLLPDGHYMGEMLVSGTQNRAESNGLLNSDNPPMDRIVFQVWDYVTPEEYVNALRKVKNTTPYKKRFEKLKEIVSGVGHKQLQIIESHIVNSIQEAFEKVTGWMEQDLEGGILKDVNGVFKDGTSKHQLKMKLEMSIDVRVTGFKEGRIGTKREKTFGAIEYKTDDDKIKGSCSGFSDEQLEQINNNRDWYIGKIIAVGCNDITKGRDNDYYALSHPRFDEVRTDKTETDTLERALEIKQMAMCFS
jgi:DNA ligase 1